MKMANIVITTKMMVITTNKFIRIVAKIEGFVQELKLLLVMMMTMTEASFSVK